MEAWVIQLQVQGVLEIDAAAHRLGCLSDRMNMPIGPRGGNESKADIVRDATTIGLGEFPDTTEIGLWVFSDQLAPPNDWQEVVSTGLLGEPMDGVTRLVELQRASAALPTMVHGTTALYSTALATYLDGLAAYDPVKVNAVVFMTEGFNDTDHGPDLATTVATLRSWVDPRRPLPLFTIGIGPAADMNALQQLAAANGRAYRVSSAMDIVNVFLDVLAQRACATGCGRLRLNSARPLATVVNRQILHRQPETFHPSFDSLPSSSIAMCSFPVSKKALR